MIWIDVWPEKCVPMELHWSARVFTLDHECRRAHSSLGSVAHAYLAMTLSIPHTSLAKVLSFMSRLDAKKKDLDWHWNSVSQERKTTEAERCDEHPHVWKRTCCRVVLDVQVRVDAYDLLSSCSPRS